MARLKGRNAASSPPISTSALLRITSAFDQAIGVHRPNPASTNGAAPPKKKRRVGVIDDDEEDDDEDEEMELVASNAYGGEQQHQPAEGEANGGFVDGDDPWGLKEFEPGGSDGGGGFIVEGQGDSVGEQGFQLDLGNVGPGGGFFPDEDGGGGGGFIRESEEGGGFIRDDDAVEPGGFLPDSSTGFDTYDPSQGGGFLPEPTSYFSANIPPLPSPPPLPPKNADRIPLHKIPAALEALHIPSRSHELMQMFKDVAEADEEGVESVSKEDFVRACKVLVDSDDEDEEEEGEDEEKEESDESEGYQEESEVKQRRRRPPTRSTRSNPVGMEKGKGKAVELDDDVLMDLGELASESEASAEDSDDSDAEVGGGRSTKGKGKKGGAGAKGKGGKGKATGKRRGRKDRDRVLTFEEMEEARDTFELFFEGSDQLGAKGYKAIGVAELRRVAGFLNEKITEDELQEMLDERRAPETLSRRSTIHAPTTPGPPSSLFSVPKPTVDPRAISLQALSTRKAYAADIVAFLNARQYVGPTGRDTVGPADQKQLEGVPTGPQFVSMLKFLIACVEPKFRWGGRGIKFEEECLDALRAVGYPFVGSIRPAQIQTIAGKNWHALLAAFHYIVTMVESREKAVKEAENLLLVPHPDDAVEEGMPHPEVVYASWIDFTSEAYPAFLSVPPDEEDPENDELLEVFYGRVDYGRDILRTRVNDLELEAQELEKEWNQMVVKPDPKLSMTKSDAAKFARYVEGVKEKIKRRDITIKEHTTEKEARLTLSHDHHAPEILRLQTAVRAQGMSPTEVAHLSSERAKLAEAQASINKKQGAKLETMGHLEIELAKKLERANRMIARYQTKAEVLGVLPRAPEALEHVQFEQEVNGAMDNPVSELKDVKPAMVELRKKEKEKLAKTGEADLELEEKITEIKEVLRDLKETLENDEEMLRQLETMNVALKENVNTELTTTNNELESLAKQVYELYSTAGHPLAIAQARYDQRVKELEQEGTLANEVRTANRAALEHEIEELIAYKQHVCDRLPELMNAAERQGKS
ncbi:hypothetical protein MNV49_006046 [Pseudohyphozyma bogoriensis]|nr:hypothetical protein MNV49_006046 [Pseudohyphozyma bogoriensis]